MIAVQMLKQQRVLFATYSLTYVVTTEIFLCSETEHDFSHSINCPPDLISVVCEVAGFLLMHSSQ